MFHNSILLFLLTSGVYTYEMAKHLRKWKEYLQCLNMDLRTRKGLEPIHINKFMTNGFSPMHLHVAFVCLNVQYMKKTK